MSVSWSEKAVVGPCILTLALKVSNNCVLSVYIFKCGGHCARKALANRKKPSESFQDPSVYDAVLAYVMCSGNVLAFLGSPPLFTDQSMVLPNLVLMLRVSQTPRKFLRRHMLLLHV